MAVRNLDLVSYTQFIEIITAIFGELDRDVVGEATLVLLDNDQSLAKTTLPERLGLLDHMNLALYDGIRHLFLCLGVC
jgi:hypothetical protein